MAKTRSSTCPVVRRSRRAIPSSTIPARTRRRCATRIGRCISRSCRKPRRASSPRSADPVRSRHGQPQARSIRDAWWRQEKDAFWFRRRARRTGHGLHIRLEHAAHRPDAVAQGARNLQGIPAPAVVRRATTWTRSWSSSRMQGRTRASSLDACRRWRAPHRGARQFR